MSWLASASTAPWERALSWTLILRSGRPAFSRCWSEGPSISWTPRPEATVRRRLDGALGGPALRRGLALGAAVAPGVGAADVRAPCRACDQGDKDAVRAPTPAGRSAGRDGASSLHWRGSSPTPLDGLALAGARVGARGSPSRRLAPRAKVLNQAIPATNPVSSAAFAGLVSRMDVPRHVRLLESPDVDAPVTVRWRQPAVVFPRGLADEITPDAFEALAAHELAHVERRDYLASLAQTVPSTLLFFSPATHWLSARVREAREQRCDDRAVEACGRSSTYVAALGALAERGYALGAVLGAAAPRVADRIRRLSHGDMTMTLSPIRWWTLATAMIALGLVAAGTGAASLFDVTQKAELEGGPEGATCGAATSASSLWLPSPSPVRPERRSLWSSRSGSATWPSCRSRP